jgi:hypothetical protein
MPQITLPPETVRQLAETDGVVELRDADGELLGVFEPGLSQADIEFFDFICEKGWGGSFAEYRHGILEGRRAMRDPNYAKDWKTTQQILDKLKSLA